MVVYIDSFLDRIAPEPLDILASHAGAEEMGREPVAAAMRAKAILKGRSRIMQPDALCRSHHRLICTDILKESIWQKN